MSKFREVGGEKRKAIVRSNRAGEAREQLGSLVLCINERCDYSDHKALPHVAVALRQKKQGKSEADLVNHFIPYVICSKMNISDQERQQEEKAGGLSSKAYHPDELLGSKG